MRNLHYGTQANMGPGYKYWPLLHVYPQIFTFFLMVQMVWNVTYQSMSKTLTLYVLIFGRRGDII